MENLIIVGTSSTAQQVFEMIQYHHLFNVIGFAVNKSYKKESSLLGRPVYNLEFLNDEIDGPFLVFVAVQWNRLNAERRKLYKFCESQKYEFANIISPTAIVRSKINGNNCYIDDYVVIMNGVTIDDDVYIKSHAVIGSNTYIKSHTFIGVHAQVSGGSIIGEQSFIGVNATIFDNTTIGDKCIIGACSSVKRNVPDFSKWQNTNDYFVKQYTEDEIEEKLMSTKNVR